MDWFSFPTFFATSVAACCLVMLSKLITFGLPHEIKNFNKYVAMEFKNCFGRLVLRILRRINLTILDALCYDGHPPVVPAACIHIDVSHRGTNGYWTRVSCKDCGECIQKTRRPALPMLHNFAAPLAPDDADSDS
jgi:hypothetical protein